MPDDPCDIVGPAGDICKNGGVGPTPAVDAPESADPLTAFAHSVADGAAWVVTQLSKTLTDVGAVDFTRGAFLKQYAIVFAAATVLTIMVWLVAVAKRAMRGVPVTTAIGEAVGLLWLTVIASAFTPLVLHVLVGAVDAVTDAAAGGSSGDLFASLAATLRAGHIGGGPLILLLASVLTIILAGVLWLELVVRAAALWVGALLGTLVYAGLADKALWSKVRQWAGVMIAIILVKPIVMVSLGIAAVFTAERGPNATPVVVAGIAVIVIALAASVSIFRFVPGYGDDLGAGLAIRAAKTGSRVGVKAVTSATGVVASGIQTHGARTPRQSTGGSRKGSSGVSEGIQAHGSRPDKGKSGK